MVFFGLQANSTPALSATMHKITAIPASLFGGDQDVAAVGTDSVPKPRRHVQKFVHEEDNKRVEMEMTDGQLTRLNIDGKDIPASEFSQHQALTNDLLHDVPPPPPPPPGARWQFNGSPAVVSTEKGDDGATTIRIERDGKPTELRVKDGTVWLDGRQMKNGERMELPGGTVFAGSDFRVEMPDIVMPEIPEIPEMPERPEMSEMPPMPPMPPMPIMNFHFDGLAPGTPPPLMDFHFDGFAPGTPPPPMDKKAWKAWEKEFKKQWKEQEKEWKKQEKEWKKQGYNFSKEQMEEFCRAQMEAARTQMQVQQEYMTADRERQRAQADAMREQTWARTDARREVETARRDARREVEAARREADREMRRERRAPGADGASRPITDALLQDHLISDPEQFKFRLTGKELLVNGVAQPESVHQRYLELYRNSTGKALKNSDSFEMEQEH
jgi:hypothetical protein